MPAARALDTIRARASRNRAQAAGRWHRALGTERSEPLDDWVRRFAQAGRLTLNFHPDRVARSGLTVAAGLRTDGRYRSQWVTGISSGTRSAIPGGDRHRMEQQLFDGAYVLDDPAETEFPVYGAFDLLHDPHGGSPRFGSSYLLLRRHVLDRTTLSVGDSNSNPQDVGTADAPCLLLAGLAEQAAAGALLWDQLGGDDLFAALRGEVVARRPRRNLNGHLEAQVHGGVELAVDVEAVVLDPSYIGTEVEDDLAAAAECYGFELLWHAGSELAASDTPDDFRGPVMPDVARRVARADGVVDAAAIGRAARLVVATPPLPGGDPPESELQLLKYLWHTVLAYGDDAHLRNAEPAPNA